MLPLFRTARALQREHGTRWGLGTWDRLGWSQPWAEDDGSRSGVASVMFMDRVESNGFVCAEEIHRAQGASQREAIRETGHGHAQGETRSQEQVPRRNPSKGLSI